MVIKKLLLVSFALLATETFSVYDELVCDDEHCSYRESDTQFLDLPAETFAALKELSEELGISMGELVRNIIAIMGNVIPEENS